MPQNDFPLINGVYHSWSELSLIMAAPGMPPFRPSDFTAASFKESLEPGDVRGKGGGKRGTTEGMYDAEGSVTMLLAAHLQFVQGLARIARAKKIKLGAVQFTVGASWRAQPGSPLVRAQLIGCRIKERSFDASPASDAIEVETPLNVTLVRVNGLSLGEIPKS